MHWKHLAIKPSVQCFVRAPSHTRTKHRGTRTRPITTVATTNVAIKAIYRFHNSV